MSTTSDLELEFISNYITTSAFVLLSFDTIISISTEVEVIWSRKWTTMTWLYVFTRYATLILVTNKFTPATDLESCKAGIYIVVIFQSVQFLCFASFSALRVYALLDGKYAMACIIFLLNLVPFATNMFANIAIIVTVDPELCIISVPVSAGVNTFLSLFTRISVILGDVLVLAVTWMRTAESYREARRLNIKTPLTSMLLRDGTIYFIILLIINVLDVIDQNVPTLFYLDLVGAYFTILPSIIVCRFILSLRQIKPAGSSLVSGSHGQQASLRFAGNMGQSLEFGADGEEDIGFEGAGDDLAPALVCDSEENQSQNAGSHHDTVSQQSQSLAHQVNHLA